MSARSVGSIGGGTILLYLLAFWVFANTVIARPYPSEYDNFFWGLLQGFFLVPSFVLSLFDDHVAIYQIRNIGGWYDLAFIIGVGVVFERST